MRLIDSETKPDDLKLYISKEIKVITKEVTASNMQLVAESIGGEVARVTNAGHLGVRIPTLGKPDTAMDGELVVRDLQTGALYAWQKNDGRFDDAYGLLNEVYGPYQTAVWRKKRTVVYAVEVTGENLELIECWCGGAIPQFRSEVSIPSLDGAMLTKPGDWITMHHKDGKMNVVNGVVFKDTYEEFPIATLGR